MLRYCGGPHYNRRSRFAADAQPKGPLCGAADAQGTSAQPKWPLRGRPLRGRLCGFVAAHFAKRGEPLRTFAAGRFTVVARTPSLHLPTFLPPYLPTCTQATREGGRAHRLLPPYLPTFLPPYLPTSLPSYMYTGHARRRPSSSTPTSLYLPTCTQATQGGG